MVKHICQTCEKEIHNAHKVPHRCSGCHLVYYCDRNCQETDWYRHFYFCFGKRSRRPLKMFLDPIE